MRRPKNFAGWDLIGNGVAQGDSKAWDRDCDRGSVEAREGGWKVVWTQAMNAKKDSPQWG